MIKKSLNLSGKIDTQRTQLFSVISRITTELNIPYVVVGATARDIVLHYGFGAKIQRATTDIDFAIEVASWQQFDLLKQQLLINGFKETQEQQRFIDNQSRPIDIIPFGPLQNEQSNIQWPPPAHQEMSVLGFQEACDNAYQVVIDHEAPLTIPVVSPEGLMILKIIAWHERDRTLRKKDAKDIAYLLSTYYKVTGIKVLYDNGLMEQYNHVAELAGAHLLGEGAAVIAEQTTKEKINDILKVELAESQKNYLIEEMCENIGQEFEEKLSLLQAFAKGFG